MKTRIISAIVMLLVLIPITILGGLPFTILFTVLGVLGLYEFLKLEKDIPYLIRYSAILFSIVMILYNYRDTTVNYLLNYKLLAGMMLFYFITIVLVGNNDKFNYKKAFYLIVTTLLIGISFNGFIIMRNLGGSNLIFYFFMISALTDSFALFGGKLFGKHKLSKLSPKKTIEGSIIGSVIGSVCASLFGYYLLTNSMSFISIFMLSLVLSVFGQCGDLFFSAVKREYGIKDYSNLIPGHGGILDRLDSVIFVLLGYILIML